MKELCRILRVCRLYDYNARCWTDYDGRPTSARARFHEAGTLYEADRFHEANREAGG
ncbi:hypothetical protein WMF04_47345 [Sorangium sp. So ce260]|uniref:hypothetical protein n=1 Tax=Sorangium sp. So ce260 TaxID=3133291 RepID=UPI003F604019